MILIIKHVLNEGPGLIGKYFYEKRIETATVELENGDKLPRALDDIEAIVSMGGPMNVYQENEYPFLKDEDLLMKAAFRKNIPVMGICLGAQLMAKALGARVQNAKAKEYGWHKIRLNKNGLADPVFSGVDKTLDVFQCHEDMFEVPEGAVLLAENPACPQAFRYGDNSYGFQFHIEVTPGIINNWVENGLQVRNKESIIRGFENKRNFKSKSYKIFDNFYHLISFL